MWKGDLINLGFNGVVCKTEIGIQINFGIEGVVYKSWEGFNQSVDLRDCSQTWKGVQFNLGIEGIVRESEINVNRGNCIVGEESKKGESNQVIWTGLVTEVKVQIYRRNKGILCEILIQFSD